MDPGLSQAFTQCDAWQCSQISQLANPPATEGFQKPLGLLGRVSKQYFHRQTAQMFRFFAFRNHSYARKSSSRKDSRIRIARHGHAGIESNTGNLTRQRARNLWQRTKERLQSSK